MLNQQVEKTIEQYWPEVQKLIQEKVAPSALAAAKDDKAMGLLLTPVYQMLPLPVRMVIKKDVFIGFCLQHRDRLIPAATPAEGNKISGLKCCAHNDRNAIAVCGKCGLGLCKECHEIGAYDDKHLCKQCLISVVRVEYMMEEDDLKKFRKTLRILVVFASIGLFLFFLSAIGRHVGLGIGLMWFFWGIGDFVSSFTSGLAKTIMSGSGSFGSKMGAIFLGPFILAPIFVPKDIIGYFSNVRKTEKSIAEYKEMMLELDRL